jgi:F0F1-type ATP synthase assembly protein I
VSDSDPRTDEDVQSEESRLVPPRDIITGSFSRGADLLSYLVSGVLLGLLFDWIFGTSPIMVILWTLAALGLGYWRLWQSSEVLDEEGKARSHGA